MFVALQFAAPERPAGAAPPPGRTAEAATQPGPRFADLLQRGQATHGVLAQPPEPAAPGAEGAPGPGPDAADDTETRQDGPPARRRLLPGASARPAGMRTDKAAVPVARAARDAALPALRQMPPEAASEDSPVVTPATAPPPGAVPSADLRDWLATLKALEPVVAKAPAEESAGSTGGTLAPATRRDVPEGAEAPLVVRTSDDPGKGSESLLPALATPPLQALETVTPQAAEPRSARAATAAAADTAPLPTLNAVGAVPRGFVPLTMAPIALATPVYSPEFAQVLGAQVSLCARDGVQQAELHLNPAEMGPISVQIRIDGVDARVDFGADMLATREIIERGLPELASALREQGLTLSGGGVFQHAPGSRDRSAGEPGGGASRPSRRVAAVDAAAPRTLVFPASQGMLDLYA